MSTLRNWIPADEWVVPRQPCDTEHPRHITPYLLVEGGGPLNGRWHGFLETHLQLNEGRGLDPELDPKSSDLHQMYHYLKGAGH